MPRPRAADFRAFREGSSFHRPPFDAEWYGLLAGLLETTREVVEKRERKRRQQRAIELTAVFTVAALIVGAIAVSAWHATLYYQRRDLLGRGLQLFAADDTAAAGFDVPEWGLALTVSGETESTIDALAKRADDAARLLLAYADIAAAAGRPVDARRLVKAAWEHARGQLWDMQETIEAHLKYGDLESARTGFSAVLSAMKASEYPQTDSLLDKAALIDLAIRVDRRSEIVTHATPGLLVAAMASGAGPHERDVLAIPAAARALAEFSNQTPSSLLVKKLLESQDPLAFSISEVLDVLKDAGATGTDVRAVADFDTGEKGDLPLSLAGPLARHGWTELANELVTRVIARVDPAKLAENESIVCALVSLRKFCEARRYAIATNNSQRLIALSCRPGFMDGRRQPFSSPTSRRVDLPIVLRVCIVPSRLTGAVPAEEFVLVAAVGVAGGGAAHLVRQTLAVEPPGNAGWLSSPSSPSSTSRPTLACGAGSSRSCAPARHEPRPRLSSDATGDEPMPTDALTHGCILFIANDLFV